MYRQGSYSRIGNGYGTFGLNDEGKVVGFLQTTAYDPNAAEGTSPFNTIRNAFLYFNGTMTDLSELAELKDAGWSEVRLYGMNDAGQIVGEGIVGGRYRALLLTPSGG